jgi:hypothetical protein
MDQKSDDALILRLATVIEAKLGGKSIPPDPGDGRKSRPLEAGATPKATELHR